MRGAHRDVWCSKAQSLIEAELFAATVQTPCTEWPRTVMRGKSRKVNSGHNSCPISKTTHGTELPYPCLAEHLRYDGSKEGQGSQEGTGNHVWCPVPFCPPPWARRLRRRRRPNVHAHFERKSRLQRRAAVSAEGLPSSDGKAEGALIACGGRPPDRRNRLPSADGKKKKDLC